MCSARGSVGDRSGDGHRGRSHGGGRRAPDPRGPGDPLPRLPGDIAIERRAVRIFIPIGTSILVSLILTVLLNLFLRR
ncbi:MAG: DUF2905 domain-containing protein [Actinomycetota bacterium]|nr:DUF2905 domain-containing protein [Actinomycetota bacterium]